MSSLLAVIGRAKDNLLLVEDYLARTSGAGGEEAAPPPPVAGGEL